MNTNAGEPMPSEVMPERETVCGVDKDWYNFDHLPKREEVETLRHAGRLAILSQHEQ